MSEQRRRKGPMGGRGMQPTEKAKDFKGAMAKLFRLSLIHISEPTRH